MPITTKELANLKPKDKRYKIADGNGLYIEVMPNGNRYWRYAYRINDKQKTATLGEYPGLSLKDARSQHIEMRTSVAKGVDPAVRQVQDITDNTFGAVALRFYHLNEDRWSKKHRIRTENYLKNRVNPVVGHLPIDQITARHLLPIFAKIEQDKLNDTAGRVKTMISQIFRLGIAQGACAYDPARDLQGAIRPSKTGNFAAIIEPDEFAQLLLAIENYPIDGITRWALRLIPKVMLRPQELRTLQWEWIDFDNSLVVFPAEVMKMGREHILPLSTQAMSIINHVAETIGTDSKFVFRSVRTKDRPISDGTLNAALKLLGYGGDRQTPHGFRASARTLLDEELGYRVDYIEHQLAHAVKDPTGRSYNRTSFLAQRKEMMQAWADYLDDLVRKKRAGKKISRRLGQ